MRKLAYALLTAGSIGLGGCASITPANVTTVISQVQADAVAVCGFLPTAATVANIISAGNPLIATVSAIAEAICSAVLPAKLGRKLAVIPTVNGVPIHGRFVR
jgi:hypothetical protein